MEWSEVINNPVLKNLPFKIELNKFGKLLMTPASNSHGRLQGRLAGMLWSQQPGGEVIAECSIETSDGVKVAAIAWVSAAFGTASTTEVSCIVLFANARRRGASGYGSYERRGTMGGKRHISERPREVEAPQHYGHWEVDAVMGSSDQHCIVTMMERKSNVRGDREVEGACDGANERKTQRIDREAIQTSEDDHRRQRNGVSPIQAVEDRTGASFYFVTLYHSWERGLNENTNGLIRQYLPKGKSMRMLTQRDCNDIARALNQRPRKLLGYKTPEQVYEQSL